MNIWRIVASLLALTGICIISVGHNYETLTITVPTQIIVTAATIVFTLYSVCGPSRLSAIAGKLLITISLLALITQLVTRTPTLIGLDTLSRTITLASGLLLIKISPHQQLYSWMFLMIATKVEIIAIGALVSLLPDLGVSYAVPLFWWWLIIPLMLFGVMCLLLQKPSLYRIVALITTAYALILAVIFISHSQATLPSLIAIGIALWPAVTERLIGYRAFKRSARVQPNTL